jgi:hypothetical protein
MLISTHIIISGILMILLSLIHIPFPKYFNWKEELKNLSLINRQMMEVHTFFIALVVLMMGLLCVLQTEALIYNPLGKIISLGFGIFWFTRLVIQFVWYSSKLWRGKKPETVLHILATLIWAYFSLVFSLNYFY